MSRATLLAKKLPPRETPVSTGFPTAPAFSFRIAQYWEVCQSEGIRWHGDELPRKFVELLAIIASMDHDRKATLGTWQTEPAVEAWDVHNQTLNSLLVTWRTAGQDAETWWDDPANSEQCEALRKVRAQTVVQRIPAKDSDGASMTLELPIYRAGDESLCEMAKSMAYRTFDHVVTNGEKLVFCRYENCKAVSASNSSRPVYHTDTCGSSQTSLLRKRTIAIRRDYRRILVSNKVLARYTQKPTIMGWFRTVERGLSLRGLIEIRSGESQWLKRRLNAAESSAVSAESEVLSRAAGQESEEHIISRFLTQLDKFYRLIREARKVDASFGSRTTLERRVTTW